IASFHPHRVERDFVIHLRIRTRPVDAGHDTLFEKNLAGFDVHLAAPGEIADFPTAQRLPIEQRLPIGRAVDELRRPHPSSLRCWDRGGWRIRSAVSEAVA